MRLEPDVQMKSTACLICGAADAEPHVTGQDLLHGTPGEFRLVRCRRCSLIYQDPRPTVQEISRCYPPSYAPYTVRCRGLPFLHGLDLAYGQLKRANAIALRHGPGALLDVGCATGAFLEEMRARGWKTSGVEINGGAAVYAREQLGLDVVCGELADARFPDRTFDVVTLWDVLEHLHDPLGVLREIRRVLRDDGLLVMSTPDVESLDSRLFGRYWAGYDLPRHLCVFSRGTLGLALERAGFATKEFQYITGNYHSLVLSLDFWLKAAVSQPERRRTLRSVAHFPGFRALYFPITKGRNRLGGGPTMTVFARKRAGG